MFKKKTKVILDTNILLLPGQRAVDVFTDIPNVLNEPHTLCTYQGVIAELQKLAEKKSKDAFSAKLGYIMAKQKALKILPSSINTHIDDVIVENANPPTMIVVTQDRGLAKRLRSLKVRVLRYEQHKFVFEK